MLKISFWLKKSDTDQGSLEYIAFDNPKKILEGKLTGMFACETYLPDKKKHFLIYSVNPLDALCNASEFVKVYLQGLLNRGYAISELENKELWKLEKKDPLVNLQEKIEGIKNNKDISQKDKDKILEILKESFGKTAIGEQLKKAIDN